MWTTAHSFISDTVVLSLEYWERPLFIFQTDCTEIMKFLERHEALAALLLCFPIMTLSRKYTYRLNRKS
jgi:hypothetical protein